MINFLLAPVEEKTPNCKGQIFRGHRSLYMSTSKQFGFFEKIGLTHLKRKSCKGCNKCEWILDQFSEMVYTDGIVGIETIENGKLYSVICEVLSTDWETGYAEDWVFKIVKNEGAQ